MPRILTFLLVLLLFCTSSGHAGKAEDCENAAMSNSQDSDSSSFCRQVDDVGIIRFIENSPYAWLEAAPGIREHGTENYHVTEYVVDANNDYFCVIDGILYSKDLTILYLYPPRKEGWYFQVPTTVQTIGDCAFTGSRNLREIVIPETVINLDGDDTFNYSSVEIIHFPQSITAFDPIGLYHLPCIKKLIVPQDSIIERDLMMMQNYIDYTDVILTY